MVTYPPPHLTCPIADKAQAKLYPVCDDDSKYVQRELAGDERASRLRRRDLGAPHRDDSVEVPCADAVDQSGAKHPV